MELLSHEEARIIGALIEKEHATPEYYPMTINSLTNACNQKSSRNPVVSYEDTIVEFTVQNLREKQLITKVTGPDQRVPKYGQIFTNYYDLTLPQAAVMCVLFLRGAQTIGEIRSRSHRIYDFKNLSETEQTLDELINRENTPFVIKLPKDSGRENRFTHLFYGEPEIEVISAKTPKSEDRITLLEEQVKFLEGTLESLKEEFDKFKKVFD